MSNRTGFTLFIALLGCVSVSCVLMTASPEETYFKARNDFIRQFENAADYDVEDSALAELEDKLKIIVGPVNIEGFPKQGKINLITLHKELGFGQVDGLRFESDHESLFVTTDSLLKKYLAEEPALPKELGSLSRTENFYRYVFSVDSHVTYYTEIPVKSVKEKTFAHAFLGITAQDIGPFIPTEIFVFVSNGNRIYMIYSPTTTEITEIPQCRNEWDKYYKKSEEQGFEAYYRCYGREAKNQQFFTLLQKQAQLIVDRLLKD